MYEDITVTISDEGQEGIAVLFWGKGAAARGWGRTFATMAEAEAYAALMRDHIAGRHSWPTWHVVLRRHDGTLVGELDVIAPTHKAAAERAREQVEHATYAVAFTTKIAEPALPEACRYCIQDQAIADYYERHRIAGTDSGD